MNASGYLPVPPGNAGPTEILVNIRGVSKHFVSGLRMPFTRPDMVRALDNVSLDIPAGRTLAIVGESGSGKTTLGRCVAGIYDPSEGSIIYKGKPLSRRAYDADIRLRRSVQLVFQDPSAALNSRQRVGAIIAEPIIVHGLTDDGNVVDRVGDLLRSVGLGPDDMEKFPHEFSGGQKQRIVIARALALEPELLICDEAVSALDVSVQAQIINLLKDLQDSRGITYLFISHDMAVVRHIAHWVVVMKEGKLVEQGETEAVLRHPVDPYTRALIAAVPKGIARHRQ